MHERDREAKIVSVHRWQARQNVPAQVPTFSLFNVSAISVAGAIIVSTVCGFIGDQLVYSPSQNLHQGLAYSSIILTPFLSGFALGILIQRSRRLPKPGLWRAGFAVWSWLLVAAFVYCISNGMTPLIMVVVLFTYGLFLQLLAFGLALSGVFIARYIKPQNIG